MTQHDIATIVRPMSDTELRDCILYSVERAPHLHKPLAMREAALEELLARHLRAKTTLDEATLIRDAAIDSFDRWEADQKVAASPSPRCRVCDRFALDGSDYCQYHGLARYP